MLASASLLASPLRWTGVVSKYRPLTNSTHIKSTSKLVFVRTGTTAGLRSDSRNSLVDCKLRKSADTIYWQSCSVDTSKSNTTGSRLGSLGGLQTAGTTLFTRSFASATSTGTTAGLFIVTTPITTTGSRNMSSSPASGALGKLKILIFYGSTRQGRHVERVGEFVKSVVTDQGMEAIVMDPLKIPFEMLKRPLHFYPNPADAPAFLHTEHEKIKNADGFIILSSEYNAGIPPPLANMMDHFPPQSYRHKPVGLVTYSMGSFGGARVQVILHPFVSELGMVSIPATVTIPTVQNAINDTGKCLEDRIAKNAQKLVAELGWYATGLKNQRAAQAPPS